MTSGQRNYKEPVLFSGILLGFILIPLVFGVITGQAAEGVSGIEALKSSVSDVFCVSGYSPALTVFLIEIGVMLAVVVAASVTKSDRWWLRSIKSQGGLIVALMALVVIPFVIAWQTESSVCVRGKSFFWQSIFIEVFILAALALSYNLMFGFSGVVSFGHAAFFGTGAYGVGLLMLHLEWPLWLSVFVTLLVSMLLGLFVSVVGVRIRGLYFAIFTLAFAEIFFILAQNRILTEITGAEDGFTFGVPDWINATQNRLTFYYLALAFLVFAFWLIRKLVNSPTGKVMGALRDNEDRATMLGFNTFWFKTLSIVVAGVLASSAGILRALLNKGVSPNVLGINFTMDPLIHTLIGGTGTFAGPAVGAFLLRLTEQLLRDATIMVGSTEINIGERWALILGVLFILSVMVFPSGIVGTARAAAAKRKRRKQAE
jgi:branched-chain amino acid transport system permease protein